MSGRDLLQVVHRSPSVGVVGAGIAGLTVAHELVERGFAVTVHEAAPAPGGKAGSERTVDGLVREHVNKNYSAHYYCLPETLRRIPCEGGGTVFDRLLPSMNSVCRFPDGSEVELSGRMKMTRSERLREALRFIRAFARQGLPLRDALSFVYAHARLALLCEARRERELSGVSYRDYLGVDRRAAPFRHLLQMIEISAAANVDGPARAAAEQTFRIFGRIFNPHQFASMINFLDGPSEERLFRPWREHLGRLGVTLRCGSRVLSLERAEGRHGLRLSSGSVEWHDVVVIATGVTALRHLLPELGLPEACEKWANGFYFVLRERPAPVVEGELRFCLGSPWSLITGYRCFDGRWYFWACASNASAAGVVHGRRYPECSEAQLRDELIAQSGFEHPGLIEHFVVGQGLEWRDGGWHNGAPLYAATLGVAPIENSTGLPGLYIAGEATRTTVTVATMEKANESAKRCAAAICAAHGIEYPRDKFDYDPFPFAPMRRLDAWLERLRRPQLPPPDPAAGALTDGHKRHSAAG